MEPNDKMLVDEHHPVQDIEDIGKTTFILADPINTLPAPKEEPVDLESEPDEDINKNSNALPSRGGMVIDEAEAHDENHNDNSNNIQGDANQCKEPQVLNHKKEKSHLMRFPLAKIKNTMKLDDDIGLCQKNAYFVIGKMTELFLQELAQSSHLICKMSKRKTLNIDDIHTAIKAKGKYSFIDMASIFHVDVLGSNVTKDKKAKKAVNQSTLAPEASELIKSPVNSDITPPKSEKPKRERAKAPPKKTEPVNNMKIDQMFFK